MAVQRTGVAAVLGCLLVAVAVALAVAAGLVGRLGLVGGDAIGAADNADGARLFCVAELAPGATDARASGHGIVVTEFRTGGPPCRVPAPATSPGLVLDATVALAAAPRPHAGGAGRHHPLLPRVARRRPTRGCSVSARGRGGRGRSPPVPDDGCCRWLSSSSRRSSPCWPSPGGRGSWCRPTGSRRGCWARRGPPGRCSRSPSPGPPTAAPGSPRSRSPRWAASSRRPPSRRSSPSGSRRSWPARCVTVGTRAWRRRVPGLLVAGIAVALAAAPVLAGIRYQDELYAAPNTHDLIFTAILPESGPGGPGRGRAAARRPGRTRASTSTWTSAGASRAGTRRSAPRPVETRALARTWVAEHPVLLARMVHRGLVATLRPEVPYLVSATAGAAHGERHAAGAGGPRGRPAHGRDVRLLRRSARALGAAGGRRAGPAGRGGDRARAPPRPPRAPPRGAGARRGGARRGRRRDRGRWRCSATATSRWPSTCGWRRTCCSSR